MLIPFLLLFLYYFLLLLLLFPFLLLIIRNLVDVDTVFCLLLPRKRNGTSMSTWKIIKMCQVFLFHDFLKMLSNWVLFIPWFSIYQTLLSVRSGLYFPEEDSLLRENIVSL